MIRHAIDVANFFVTYSGYTKTPLQVQKLTYISHGYMLGIHDIPLVHDTVEAWEHGPVFPEVHHTYKGYGSGVIGRVSHEPKPFVDQRQRDILTNVFEYYGRFCGYFLSDITHDNSVETTPWRQCYVHGAKHTPIDNSITKKYYKALHEKQGFEY